MVDFKYQGAPAPGGADAAFFQRLSSEIRNPHSDILYKYLDG
jgi:hypothetical protein